MTDIRVHNPQAVEVVYTADGHIVAGHASAAANPDDPVTARLLAAGRLVIPTIPEPRRSRRQRNNAPADAGTEGDS